MTPIVYLQTCTNEGLRQYLPIFDYELIDLNRLTAEWIITRPTGRFIQSTFLVFKHKNNKVAIREFSKEIFIFVEQRILTQEEKSVFLRQILSYIFTAFRFKKEEFTELVKQLPAMTQILKGSLYEQLIEEGMEKGLEKGTEKGVFIANIARDVELLGRLAAQSLPLDALQAISGLPVLVVDNYMTLYTSEKQHTLLTAIQNARSGADVEAMRALVISALSAYGLGDTAIEAFFKEHK